MTDILNKFDLITVSSSEEGASDWSSIASMPDGGFITVWHDGGGKDGSQAGVYGRILDSDYQRVGDEFLVNTLTNGFQTKARVATLSDGTFMVVWAGGDGSYQGQVFSVDGTKSGSQFTVGPWFIGESDIIGSSDDKFLVLKSQNNENAGILSVYSRTGEELVASVTVTSDGGGESRIIELASDRYLVAWYDARDVEGFDIHAQIFDGSGTLIGDEFLLNSTLDNNQQAPELVSTGDGSFAAVWQSYSQDGELFDIYFRAFDSSGVPTTDEVLVNTTTDGQQIKPSIARLEDGSFVVAWQSDHLGASQILYQKVSQTGQLIGSNRILSENDTGSFVNGNEVALTTLANGSVMASWDHGGNIYAKALSDDDLYIVDDQNFWDLWSSGAVIYAETGADHLYLAPEAPIESLPDAETTTAIVGLDYFGFDLDTGRIDTVANPGPYPMAVTEGTYPLEGSDLKAPTFLDFENFSYYGDADAKIADTSDDNVLITGGGEDVISSIGGRDLILSHEQSDEIILSSSKTYASNIVAHNISADWQIGTNARVSVSGKTQFETVVNGGEGYDVVTLTDKSDAYFLHDNHSAFNTDIILSEDFRGRDGFNRISLIEEIASGDGNDVIDLTSPDYSLAGQTLLVNAGDGQDVVWGSDADETLIGGADNDVMFGGAGINELFGGSGADEFQFTRTSENDTVSDFSIADGDTLKFFNKGGALFDRDSLSLNAAGDELSIAYGDEIGEILTITLYEAGLNLDDLTADVLIIV